jgi:hypothetical protein
VAASPVTRLFSLATHLENQSPRRDVDRSAKVSRAAADRSDYRCSAVSRPWAAEAFRIPLVAVTLQRDAQVLFASVRRQIPLRCCRAVGLLVVHATMLSWCAARHTPTFHEVGHLPAGLSHLELGRFELYRVNPPLVRTWAAFAVLFAQPIVS